MIKDSWVVRQFKNEYNPTHWHDGHLSGAGFLKVPKELGQHTQSQKEGNKDYKCESCSKKFKEISTDSIF